MNENPKCQPQSPRKPKKGLSRAPSSFHLARPEWTFVQQECMAGAS
jgi:hypothetical protein